MQKSLDFGTESTNYRAHPKTRNLLLGPCISNNQSSSWSWK